MILVRYKKSWYKINLRDGIFIWKQTAWLLIRRLLRFGKRIRNRSLNIVIVLICAILFSTLIIPIGINIEKYETWYDGLWDLRTFFLTSILIVFVNTNVAEERRRNEGLHKLFSTYSSFMFDSEYYIRDLLETVGLSYRDKIFLTQDSLYNFEEYLEEIIHYVTSFNTMDKNDIKTYMIHLHQKQLIEFKNVLHDINTIEPAEIRKDRVREWASRAVAKVESEIIKIQFSSKEYTPLEVINYIRENLINFEYSIAELRRPWRWDHERNMNIRYRLIYSGKIVSSFDTNEYWFDKRFD